MAQSQRVPPQGRILKGGLRPLHVPLSLEGDGRAASDAGPGDLRSDDTGRSASLVSFPRTSPGTVRGTATVGRQLGASGAASPTFRGVGKPLSLGLCLLVSFCIGAAICVWPSSFDTATAFVATSSDVVSRSVKRVAVEYASLNQSSDGAPVVSDNQPALQTTSYNRGATLAGSLNPTHELSTATASLSSRTVVPFNRAAVTAKVFRIVREHAPRNRNAHELAEAIVAEARLQQFDPLFVAAVIKSESTFNAFARSNKGAQGLMQLMPATGKWLAQLKDLPRGDLTDPGYNLHLGVSYLKQLESSYGGDRVLTLIAYNWGPGRVESASDGKRRVPPEVVTYAVKIMNDYRRWQHDIAS